MTLSHKEELRDRVERLLADVGPLATVSALGFAETSKGRVDECVAAVRDEKRWQLVDLRALDGKDAIKPLKAAGKSGVVVVLTRPDATPQPLLSWVRARVDKQAQVDLGDFAAMALPEEQSLVVLCEGCSDLSSVSRELRRIPYWEFIP